jgi:hypothetical protein
MLLDIERVKPSVNPFVVGEFLANLKLAVAS